MKQILAYGPQLSAKLDQFINDRERVIGRDIIWGADFLSRLRPFATGGKLLRGSVVCFSYAMFSGQAPSAAAFKAAMALELAHSALLIHDDVMDQDALRRGQPSLHRQYQSLAAEQGLPDAARLGENLALCGGDAAFFLGLELLGEMAVEPLVASTVIGLFARGLMTVCAGQMQDVYLESSPTMPTKRAIHDMMRAKTAYYTLALPLAMGAALAAQPPATIRCLQAIGAAAGTIFQIRDDELGLLGTAAKLGKPVGADIRKGKKTLLYYHLLKRSKPQDRVRLRAIFGNPAASPRDIAFVQTAAREYDIPALLNREIAILQASALARISSLDVPAAAKTELKSLVTFCASRQT
jgi:geranylgeranyl diphosphate synthase type I